MEETCLLLFKSTLKPEYRQRILNALAIPPKVFWSTHYNKKYCCDSLKDVIFNRNQSSSLIGKKGIFIFVDAKSEPPRFFPLRQFEIVSSKKVEDNWNLGLIFNNYIIYKEGNLSTFRRKLEEKLESLPPEGPFAQMVDRQVFNEVVQGLSHNVKFDDIIKEITNKSHEECFKKCQINQKVIPAQFFRIELEPKKGRITYDKGDIIFTPGTYRLILYYSAPEGAPFQSTFRVSGLPYNQNSSDSLTILPRTRNNIWEKEFEVPAKEKLDYIRIEGEDETGSPIVAPRLEMKYSVRIGFLDKISKNSIIGISALIVGIITIALSQPLGIPSLIPIGAALGDLGAAIIGRAHS